MDDEYKTSSNSSNWSNKFYKILAHKIYITFDDKLLYIHHWQSYGVEEV